MGITVAADGITLGRTVTHSFVHSPLPGMVDVSSLVCFMHYSGEVAPSAITCGNDPVPQPKAGNISGCAEGVNSDDLFHNSVMQSQEECRLLGYKPPVSTSQETHYVSATESNQLMLCKI
jgi:hypothetical protein